MDYERMSVFEQILAGLQQATANVRGELELRTTTLPFAPGATGDEDKAPQEPRCDD